MEPNIGKIHLFPKQLTAHGPTGLMPLNAPRPVAMAMMMVLNRNVEEKSGQRKTTENVTTSSQD